MEITHVRNRKDQWIFEYPTHAEHQEIEKFALRMKDDFAANFREINAAPVEVPPTPGLRNPV
jgi:hypothetical protein